MRKLFTFLLLAAITVVSSAQIVDPVHWTFKVKELPNNEAELQFTAKIDPSWHIYSQRHEGIEQPISFEFDQSKAYQLVGKVIEPKAHEGVDDLTGKPSRSFDGTAVFRQKIKRLSSDGFAVKGIINGQTCNEGSCVPINDVEFSFQVKGAEGEVVADAVEDLPDTMENAETLSEAEAPVLAAEESAEAPAEEKRDSLLVIFLIALAGGIVTMFTPCVFPMIPMTVNFFMHSSDNKRKNRREALTFGLSIVGIFAVLGAILTLVFGPTALNFIGTHWIPNLLFFIIFMVFALSFFGLFEIKMPEKWINASDEQADKGGFLGPFFIALTTVLVSFSCTGPIIGAALAGLATSTTDRWVSLLTMLGFGIGFALPFTLLAFFPGVLKNMKSGGWLNTVKVSFAFLELAFGLKFLQMADQYCGWGILDREVYLAFWIVIFALWGFYLLGKLRFKGDEEVKEIGVVRLFLAIFDFTFVVFMIPGLWGAPLNFIAGFLPPMDTQDFNIEKIVVQNSSALPASTVQMGSLPSDRKYADQLHMPLGFEGFYDLDEAKAWAKEHNKPIFIDFTGRNCNNCREMEQVVWADPAAKKLLNEEFVMVALYADMNAIELPESEWVQDKNGRTLKTLGRRNLNYQTETFNNNAQPYYVIIDCEGNVLTQNNFSYQKDAAKFVAFLTEGLETYKAR